MASTISNSAWRDVTGSRAPASRSPGASAPSARMLSTRRGTRRSRPRTPQTIRAPSATGSSTALLPSGRTSWPVAQRDPPSEPPAGRRGQHAPVCGDQRARAPPRRREPVDVALEQVRLAARALAHELRLRRLRDRRHQRERVRVRVAERAREVDRAEDRARRRVADRRRGACPAMQETVEVLGREDLHRVLERERGADGVRTDRRLAAQRARLEMRARARPRASAGARRSTAASRRRR